MEPSHQVVTSIPHTNTTSIVISVILGVIVVVLVGVVVWLVLKEKKEISPGDCPPSTTCPPSSGDCPPPIVCPPPKDCPPSNSGDCPSCTGNYKADTPTVLSSNCPSVTTPYIPSYPYFSTQASIKGNSRECYPVAGKRDLPYVLHNSTDTPVKIYYQMVFNPSDCFGQPVSVSAFGGKWSFDSDESYSFTIPAEITYKFTDGDDNIIQNVSINGAAAPFGGTVAVPDNSKITVDNPVVIHVSGTSAVGLDVNVNFDS